MIINLFSIFDPSNEIFIFGNWVLFLLVVCLYFSSLWLISSKYMSIIFKFLVFINQELKRIYGKIIKINSLLILILILLICILLVNLLGLLPYVFTCSSHFSLNLILSLPLWLGSIIYGWLKSYEKMFCHLVPMGTPFLLMNFMVVIETVRNLIRPLTLAIRLTANIIAGHLLLRLIGDMISNLNLLNISFMLWVQLSLVLLEVAVSFIQSYVFMILISLYLKEVNY